MPVIIGADNQSHFCPLPWNFDNKTYKTSTGTAAPNLIDGRIDTFEGPGDGVYIVADTTAQITTHLYIVASGVTSFTITGHPNDGTDGSGYSVTNTNYVVTKKNNLQTKYTWNGLSHYLFSLNRTAGVIGWNATAIQVNVVGTTARVYEIAALRSDIRLNADDYYTRFDFSRREPISVSRPNIYGEWKRAKLEGASTRWSLHATYEFKNTDNMANKNADEIMYFLHVNPNFSFIPLYEWYPDKVFTRAICPQDELRAVRSGTIRQRYELPITIMGT